MRIYFEKIKEEGNYLDFSDTFTMGDSDRSRAAFAGSIYPVKDNFIFKGKLTLNIEDKCDRCLNAFSEEISNDIVIEISREKKEATEEEIELNDEDMGLYFVEKDYLDIGEVIFQESVLLNPIKKICDDNCEGLCQICGTNLNYESCDCEESIDGRWAVLEKLLKK